MPCAMVSVLLLIKFIFPPKEISVTTSLFILVRLFVQALRNGLRVCDLVGNFEIFTDK